MPTLPVCVGAGGGCVGGGRPNSFLIGVISSRLYSFRLSVAFLNTSK